MGRMVGGILVLGLGLSVAVGQESQDRPATPSQQYAELDKEFREPTEGQLSTLAQHHRLAEEAQ